MTPFERILDAIETTARNDRKLTLGILELFDLAHDSWPAVRQAHRVGRWLWDISLPDALHQYLDARKEAEEIAAARRGPELERRLLCTLHTRATIVHLLEKAWEHRTGIVPAGVWLAQRAVQLADGLLSELDLEDIRHVGSRAHQYLQTLWRESEWLHPREELEGEYHHLRGAADATRPERWITVRPRESAEVWSIQDATRIEDPEPPQRKPERPSDGRGLREGDFLAGRVVANPEQHLHDQVRARAYLANALRVCQRLDEAEELWKEIDDLLDPRNWPLCPPESLRGEVLSLRAAFHWESGNLEEAEGCTVRAKEFLMRAGDSEFAMIPHLQLLAMMYDSGKSEEILRHRPALSEVPEWLQPYWHHLVASAHVDLSQVQEAREHFSLAEPAEGTGAAAAHQHLEANILLLEGKHTDAQEAFQTAQRLYLINGRPAEELMARLGEVLALIESNRGRWSPLILQCPIGIYDSNVAKTFRPLYFGARRGTVEVEDLRTCIRAARKVRKNPKKFERLREREPTGSSGWGDLLDWEL